jgi:NADPH2:quinone reductase
MRAALYERYGAAADVLRVGEVERPEPGPGEVRVRIECSGVNPTDWKSRSGATARPIDLFQIPHHDGAGVIDAVGDGVDPGRNGQRVWTWLAAAGRRWGTAAQWSVVPARQAVPLPEGISAELGASLGVPAMTAHRCLFADGPIAGQTVLVAGGAGAVGHFAIELAKHAGARVVTTVSNDQKADLAAAAGPDLVVNYREPGAADAIRQFAGPGGIDRVIEVALGANLELDLAVLRLGGHIVTYAAEPADPSLPVRACMNANAVLRFMLLYGVPADAQDAAAANITAALNSGALTELPVHRFGLDDIVAAQDAVQRGAVGKVLVVPG